LVFLGVPEAIYPIVAAKCDEAMPFPLPCDAAGRLTLAALPEVLRRLENCDLCAFGPGLGRSAELEALAAALAREAKTPLLIDADGINALAGNIHVWNETAYPPILTPHAGEFARLGGDLSGDRLAAARNFAVERNCVLVLKGHRTITAFPDGQCVVNTTGNPGMAKGGSGDVLTGVLAAFAARRPPRDAVPPAVFLHGLAGDLCAARLSEHAMTPTDMIAALPRAFRALTRARNDQPHPPPQR
jgi:NAD(P)H-hydrate epimerase